MTITFLVPQMHDLQTGGNVYNRRMARELAGGNRVCTARWNPGGDETLPSSVPDGGVLIVDSLLARKARIVPTLRSSRPEATLLVLAHYLRAIDPNVTAPEVEEAEREALRGVDGAIATSDFTGRALLAEGADSTPVEVVSPGLDERFRGPVPDRAEDGSPTILTVANLLPEKGLAAFVEILGGLTELDWTWTLIGDDTLDSEYAEAVRRQVHRSGLSDRVTFAGPLAPDALRAQYDRADLFALPSPFETLSMSMREAMARGLPVVAYRCGGVEQNLGDAPAGHLVPPGDERAFASALKDLLSDPAARRRMGRAGWERSQAFPTWEETAGQFREALRALDPAGG